MASNAATPVPAEAEQFPRKGAVQEVATCDRLWNRERQSLSQATQLASKLNLDHPGMVHAVKHVTTARKSATYIIFDRGYGQPDETDDDGGDEGEDEDAAPAATEPKPKAKPKPKGKPKPPAKPPQPASRPQPQEQAGGARPTPAAALGIPAAQQGTGAGKQQAAKLDRNALSACGDSARATAASQAHGREFDSKELSSLLSATRAIANEVIHAQDTMGGGSSPSTVVHVALVIDGRELGKISMFTSSRAARLLNKDLHDFGATVKQLYLSGQAKGAELRELLAHTERMETDQPESNFGGPAASAYGSATPALGRGARDAAG